MAKTCRSCNRSEVLDREFDMHICQIDGEVCGGNNSCYRWEGKNNEQNKD